MEPKIFAINIAHVLTVLRVMGYGAAWLIFGSLTLESAGLFAIGGAVTEGLYRGYRFLRRKLRKRQILKRLDFYKLDNNNKVVACTREETEQQLDVMLDMVRESESGKIGLTKAPFYKHAHVGPVCMTAAWTGASLKGEPVEPWDLVIKFENIGEERRKSFGSWEEVEAEFVKFETKFREAAGIINEATKSPTLH